MPTRIIFFFMSGSHTQSPHPNFMSLRITHSSSRTFICKNSRLLTRSNGDRDKTQACDGDRNKTQTRQYDCDKTQTPEFTMITAERRHENENASPIRVLQSSSSLPCCSQRHSNLPEPHFGGLEMKQWK